MIVQLTAKSHKAKNILNKWGDRWIWDGQRAAGTSEILGRMLLVAESDGSSNAVSRRSVDEFYDVHFTVVILGDK